MKKFALAVMAVSAMTLSAQGPQSDTVGQSVPGELLVQFKAGAAPGYKARCIGQNQRAGARSGPRRNRGRGELVLAKYQPDLPPAASQRALASDSAVEFAEPNWIYTHQATSNDTYYANGNLWGRTAPAPHPRVHSEARRLWHGRPAQQLRLRLCRHHRRGVHDIAIRTWPERGNQSW